MWCVVFVGVMCGGWCVRTSNVLRGALALEVGKSVKNFNFLRLDASGEVLVVYRVPTLPMIVILTAPMEELMLPSWKVELYWHFRIWPRSLAVLPSAGTMIAW